MFYLNFSIQPIRPSTSLTAFDLKVTALRKNFKAYFMIYYFHNCFYFLAIKTTKTYFIKKKLEQYHKGKYINSI